MPTYVFVNTKTNKQFEEFMSISAKETYLKENPHLQQVLTPTALVSMVGSLQGKTDSGFKEVMSKIAENNPSSPLAEKYGRKSIKDVKIKEVREKHRKKREDLKRK